MTGTKRMKVPGSGRKPGSTNAITRELREQLTLHLANELEVITSRLDELPLVDRYKVCAMLFRLVLPTQTLDNISEPPVIVISHDL
jgi:hypothetical protein